MTTVLSTLLVAGMIAVVACGPSVEEKAASDKAVKDSIATDEQAAKLAAYKSTMQNTIQ